MWALRLQALLLCEALPGVAQMRKSDVDKSCWRAPGFEVSCGGIWHTVLDCGPAQKFWRPQGAPSFSTLEEIGLEGSRKREITTTSSGIEIYGMGIGFGTSCFVSET